MDSGSVDIQQFFYRSLPIPRRSPLKVPARPTPDLKEHYLRGPRLPVGLIPLGNSIRDIVICLALILSKERWQEDSPLSMEVQRQQIFSEFIQLGIRGREPYRIQKEQTAFSYINHLPAHSQELIKRVRQPNNGRATRFDIYWLRTSYGQDSEPAWNTIYDAEMSHLLEEDTTCNDESLYNFAPNWEKIFLIKPELLETGFTAEEYEEATKLGLREGIELEANSPQRAENGRDPVDDADLDLQKSFSYHQAISLNRIHIVDATTLASEGTDAGKVLIVFFDKFGRTVRYVREEPFESVEMTALTNAYLDDHACWAWANIGELYQRGQPLGPPYNEHFGGERGHLILLSNIRPPLSFYLKWQWFHTGRKPY